MVYWVYDKGAKPLLAGQKGSIRTRLPGIRIGLYKERDAYEKTIVFYVLRHVSAVGSCRL